MMKYKDRAILSIIENPIVTIDLIQHLLGDYVGEGQYRYVFEFGKDKVAKVDIGNVLANASEWDVYCDVMDYPAAAKWFAPVLSCSEAAKLLVMKRADMNRPIDKYPKKIPAFFKDVKKQNFGFIGKQLVCVDYAINSIRVDGLKGFKMRDVIWKQ